MASITLAIGEQPILKPEPSQPLTHSATLAVPTRLKFWHVVVITSFAWLTMRVLFFVGFVGSDDMYYVRFAALWDRAPINHWESRLLFNAMTRLSMLLFGRGEWAAVVPCLLASFACVACVITAANRWLSTSHAVWAGLLAATLPIDVEGGTTVSAYTVMTALVLMGTLAALRHIKSRMSDTMAIALFALGVLAHRIAVFYIGTFALVLFIREKSKRRFVGQLLIGTLAALILEHVYCWILYHDFNLPFRTAIGQSQSENPQAPLLMKGVVNPQFFIWPLTHLLVSKAFCFTFVAAAIGLWWTRRSTPRELAVVLYGGCLFWVLINFGSQVPWEYRPFWRMTRFWYPLLLPVTLLTSVAIMNLRTRAQASLLGAGVIACHIVALMSSGTWGQNAQVSRELLVYAQKHNGIQFITDYHTLNEMYVANGVSTIPNVVTTDDVGNWKLIDQNARQIGLTEIDAFAEMLINPLNVAREPKFAVTSARIGGKIVWESEVKLRSVCDVVPSLANADWAVRKPAAIVRAIQRDERLTSQPDAACGVVQSSPCTGK